MFSAPQMDPSHDSDWEKNPPLLPGMPQEIPAGPGYRRIHRMQPDGMRLDELVQPGGRTAAGYDPRPPESVLDRLPKLPNLPLLNPGRA